MAKIWTAPKTFVGGVPLSASDLNTYLRDDVDYLYPPFQLQGGQTTYPYLVCSGVQNVTTDGSANFTAGFFTATGAAYTFPHAIVGGFVQAASGGSPFAVTIGTLATTGIAGHASALEGTVVVSTTLAVAYWALGY